MLALTISLVILLAGPLLLWIARKQPLLLAILDGFTLFAVGGLVCLDILPHAMEQAGWGVIPLALAGLFVPTAFERLRARGAARAHSLALILGMFGIASHAVLDGAALANGSDFSLVVAVLLHRLPVAIAVWWLVQPSYGSRAAGLVLAGIAAATTIGFFAGGAVTDHLGSQGVGYFTALVAGSLLHVLVHVHGPVNRLYDRTGRIAGTLGAVLGVWVVIHTIGHAHAGPHHGHFHANEGSAFAKLFLDLSIESSLPLLLAYGAAGLIFAFLPAATVAWLGRGRGLSSAGRGVAFALPIPICSCGVLPIYKGLVQKGVPPTAAIALLIAAPELGFDAVILSLKLIDGPFALARIAAAACLALGVAVVLGGFSKRLDPAAVGKEPPRLEGSARARLRGGLRAGFVELIDDTAPWIVLGLALAAVAFPLLDGDWLASIPDLLEVPIFALLGMPIYVCASGATPIAAVLVAQGVSPGAAIAFLLTGPATNVTTFGVLSTLHGKRFAIAFAAAMSISSIGLGYAVDAVLPSVETHFDRKIAAEEEFHGHEHHHHGHDHHHHPTGEVDDPHAEGALLAAAEGHGSGVIDQLAFCILALLFLASLLRQGPRGFVGQVLAPPGHSHGDHDHDRPSHDCSHHH